MSDADKDAEITKLRAEVVELRKGLKDMAGDMNKMQKEFGQICLAMGRAMGYVEPKDGVGVGAGANSVAGSVSGKSTESVSGKSTGSVGESTEVSKVSSNASSKSDSDAKSMLSLSSSSKGGTTTEDDSTAVSSVVVEKKPQPTPAPTPAPAPFKPTEIEVEKGNDDEGADLGEASSMSQSGADAGFVLSPSPTKTGDKGGAVVEKTQSKLFQLSDSEDSHSLGQSGMSSSGVDMSNSGVSDSLSMPSKIG
mmetsp:Transcript_20844/g.41656  ORF Transcript_20844/g.41656 Transcript_20844/m.41656 type:complete len:251 (+) Transcript_20844:95-847(+)